VSTLIIEVIKTNPKQGDKMIEVKMSFNSIEEMFGVLGHAASLPDIIVPPVTDTIPIVTVEQLTDPMETFDPETETISPIPSVMTTAELDSAGRPWDARIHTIKKTQTANGQWKIKRGTDKDLVASVLADYDITPIPAPVEQLTDTIPAPVEQLTDTIPPITPPITPESVQAKLQALLVNKKITAVDMMQKLAAHQIPTLMEIGNHLDKLPALDAELSVLEAS